MTNSPDGRRLLDEDPFRQSRRSRSRRATARNCVSHGTRVIVDTEAGHFLRSSPSVRAAIGSPIGGILGMVSQPRSEVRQREAFIVARCAIACFAVGCGRIEFDEFDAMPTTSADGTTSGDAQGSCGPFAAPVAPVEMNSAAGDEGGMMSDDRLELYFASARAGGAGAYDLYVTSRATLTAPFDPPVGLAALNTATDDNDPFVESDGLTLWYTSNQMVLRSVRPLKTSAWPAGQPVPELGDGVAVALTSDELTIYFSSSRLPNLGARDLWRASRATHTEPFASLVHETAASSSGDDCCPHLTATDAGVAFSSSRAGGYQVFVADRASDGSLGSASLFTMVDSPSFDYDVFATPDGATIGVASDRPGGLGAQDIWLYERLCQ